MNNMQDKAAIITGGTGALGRAVIFEFLEKWASVLCTYIVDEEYEECNALFADYASQLIFARADLTDRKQVEGVASKALERFGKVDILLNIAGGFAMDDVVDTDEELWDKMMDMNLKSAFLMSKYVLPHMIERGYGKIVNVTSRPGLNGGGGMGAYAASKSGVYNLTKTMAEEVLEHNINVNAIVPGTIDTPQNRRDMPDADFSKWVKPAELAKVFLFLSSDDAKLISGAAIPCFGKTAF